MGLVPCLCTGFKLSILRRCSEQKQSCSEYYCTMPVRILSWLRRVCRQLPSHASATCTALDTMQHALQLCSIHLQAPAILLDSTVAGNSIAWGTLIAVDLQQIADAAPHSRHSPIAAVGSVSLLLLCVTSCGLLLLAGGPVQSAAVCCPIRTRYPQAVQFCGPGIAQYGLLEVLTAIAVAEYCKTRRQLYWLSVYLLHVGGTLPSRLRSKLRLIEHYAGPPDTSEQAVSLRLARSETVKYRTAGERCCCPLSWYRRGCMSLSLSWR